MKEEKRVASLRVVHPFFVLCNPICNNIISCRSSILKPEEGVLRVGDGRAHKIQQGRQDAGNLRRKSVQHVCGDMPRRKLLFLLAEAPALVRLPAQEPSCSLWIDISS